MEVQKLDILKIKEYLIRKKNKKLLNSLVDRVISDIVTKPLEPDFPFTFFQGLKININSLNRFKNNSGEGLEKLLYNLVIYEVEPQDKIINLALQKCHWRYLISLVNDGYIAVEDYEKQLLASLPYCGYQAIFKVNGLNINLVKRKISEVLADAEFDFGYYLLFSAMIINTPCDEVNYQMAQKIVEYPGNDTNFIILDTLKLYFKVHHNVSFNEINDFMMKNYQRVLNDRPDIFLLFVEYQNRALASDNSMKKSVLKYQEDEQVKVIIKQIITGEERRVAYQINRGVISKSALMYILDKWMEEDNNVAIKLYLDYFLAPVYDYHNVGKALDETYSEENVILKRERREK